MPDHILTASKQAERARWHALRMAHCPTGSPPIRELLWRPWCMLGALSGQECEGDMEGYEGKTVRLKPVCPLCTGHMEPGFIPVLNESDMKVQSEWVAGEPHHRRFWGESSSRVPADMRSRASGVRRVGFSRCMQRGHSTTFTSGAPMTDLVSRDLVAPPESVPLTPAELADRVVDIVWRGLAMEP